MVEFEHRRDERNTFNFDVSIIEPGGTRRMIHSKKKENKGMCESKEEKVELFQHIDDQLEFLNEQLSQAME